MLHRIIYWLVISAAVIFLIIVSARGTDAHEDPHVIFEVAEQLDLIEGDPLYYPFIGTWEEIHHAFVEMTKACEGWFLIDRYEDIGEPSYYCDGEATMWEYRHAWNWITTHWAGERWTIYPAGTSWGAEVWRPIVTYYFNAAGIGHRVEEALAILQCESLGDPGVKNRRSSATGLYQHLSGFEDRNAWRIGQDSYDRRDPVANIAVTAAVVAADGSWRQWECKFVLN